jgi:BirA family transcriptional regulator, biotin operon repressor / biotin---[acetyl-CoA-carboxylase] ligase
MDLFPVRRFASIDSTNSEAARLASAGEVGPFWIVADEQHSGRGRNGRVWHSPPGGIYATLLYPAHLQEVRVAEFGAAMSLAVREALSAFVPVDALVLKWPNDCLVRGAKICGILSEVCRREPLVAAIGCGINVRHKPEGMPYPVTSVFDYAADATVEQVFAMLNRAASAIFPSVSQAEPGAIWRTWAAYAQPIGTPLRVRSVRHELDGTYAGLADDGALILRDYSGRNHVVHAGDVLMGQA